GISADIQGGNAGRGFASAGLGAAIGGGSGEGMTKVMTAALIGGTISKITGGKFANGAGSAAFVAVSADWSSSSDGIPTAEPEDVSNDVEINGNMIFNENITIEESDGKMKMIINGKVFSGAAGDKAQAFIDSVNKDWNGASATVDGIEYSVSVNLSLTNRSGNADFNLSNCLSKCLYDGAAGWAELGGRQVRIGAQIRMTTNIHEFGHLLGLWHQKNATNSIMSYSGDRSIHASDV
ncbi:MAG: hypothetical protein GY815_00100, partial [Gammaproteobacteria bacterium]|nr:hypothetical protein [Gammaproteobacteria bacterium]